MANVQNLVLILTGGSGFPIGDAYTNRILAFSKGFVKSGCKVTLLIIYPGRNNQSEQKGIIDGVEYYFCTNTNWPKNFINKKITGLLGIINALNLLFRLSNERHIDGIVTFSQKFSQNYPIYLFTRLKKISFIRENNEFPSIVLNRGYSRLKFLEKMHFSVVNRCYDGYIYISSALVEFNRPFIGKGMPVLIVPIIVDTDRFNFPKIQRQKQITFCGNLFGEKDGVKILLEAFAMIHDQFPDYILTLIGDISNRAEYNKMIDLIKGMGVIQKVKFTGFVHRDEIPILLKQSSLLVLARPDNIQAKGGFPTKLGEYLATGRPVLVTAVSDIPDYIQDGVNGFLAKPGSVDDFSIKIEQILTNYENACLIGKEGAKLTLTSFNNKYQAGRIIDFIGRIKGEVI